MQQRNTHLLQGDKSNLGWTQILACGLTPPADSSGCTGPGRKPGWNDWRCAYVHQDLCGVHCWRWWDQIIQRRVVTLPMGLPVSGGHPSGNCRPSWSNHQSHCNIQPSIVLTVFTGRGAVSHHIISNKVLLFWSGSSFIICEFVDLLLPYVTTDEHGQHLAVPRTTDGFTETPWYRIEVTGRPDLIPDYMTSYWPVSNLMYHTCRRLPNRWMNTLPHKACCHLTSLRTGNDTQLKQQYCEC